MREKAKNNITRPFSLSMKKGVLIGLAALCILAAAAFLYSSAFPIEADSGNLAEHLDKFLSRHSSDLAPESPMSIQVYDSVDIGAKRFTLVELGEEMQLGVARMERGINGRYRIKSARYGGGSFMDEMVENEGQKYLLIGGRNTASLIRRITVTLAHKTYNIEVPDAERFLVFVEVDPKTEAAHMDLGSMRFYNEDGREITEQVLRD